MRRFLAKPTKSKIKWKTVFKIVFFIALLIFLTIFAADIIIKQGAKKYLYSDLGEVPENRAGLLLGCSRVLHSGQPNPFLNTGSKQQ